MACLAGVAIGLLTALGGGVWQRTALPRHVWTIEQAKEFDAANAALHSVDMDDREKYAAARQRFDRVAADLQSARYAKDRLGNVLVRGGLAAAAVFSVGYLATRNA